MHDARVSRRWVWAWTFPAAVIGWCTVGALLPGAIPECGWTVIESGVVREEAWGSVRGDLVIATAVAFLWVLGFTSWSRRRRHPRVVDALMCLFIGATAWAWPYFGLAYTIGDYWSEGEPFEDVPPFGEGSCSLDWNWFAAILVIGGFFAIGGWIIWAIVSAVRRSSAPATARQGGTQ